MINDRSWTSEGRLVFVSAGDHHLLHPTIDGSTGFDILVYFYGDSPAVRNGLSARGLTVVDRKGDKFQNLLAAQQAEPQLLSRYEAVFVMDDDLALSAAEVNRLFEIRLENDFWIVQPSFDPRGRISFPYSRSRARTSFRHTNFVEMNAPLFRRDKLEKFLDVYDGSLVGWGIDYWYMNVLGESEVRRFAIVDEVTCINPDRRAASGSREIDRLQSAQEGQADWKRLRDERSLRQWNPAAFGGIKLPPLGQANSIVRAAGRNTMAMITRRDARTAMVRSARNRLKRILRDVLAGFALRRLRNQTKNGAIDRVAIDHARRAWGDSAWSATTNLVMECLDTCRTSKGVVVEFGSGFSTAVLALALSESERQFLVLEDHDDWARRLRRRLRLARIKNVRLFVRPQDSVAHPAWPDECVGGISEKIGLAIHAGPVGGTRGHLTQMTQPFRHLVGEQTVLMLDAEDQGLVTAHAWAEELGFRLEVSAADPSTGRQYAILRK